MQRFTVRFSTSMPWTNFAPSCNAAQEKPQCETQHRE